jgi:hypothetical protein
VGDERETKELNEQSGEDESEALSEACEQEKRGQGENPAGDHQEKADQTANERQGRFLCAMRRVS